MSSKTLDKDRMADWESERTMGRPAFGPEVIAFCKAVVFSSRKKTSSAEVTHPLHIRQSLIVIFTGVELTGAASQALSRSLTVPVDGASAGFNGTTHSSGKVLRSEATFTLRLITRSRICSAKFKCTFYLHLRSSHHCVITLMVANLCKTS
eukprot:XP_001708326.1 Hypothetical protein GL50803_31372 [Giardia lamblia ATCC 50803]